MAKIQFFPCPMESIQEVESFREWLLVDFLYLFVLRTVLLRAAFCSLHTFWESHPLALGLDLAQKLLFSAVYFYKFEFFWLLPINIIHGRL